MENIPYANVVGSLAYSVIYTRPDLAYVVSILSRYMGKPGKQH